MAAKDAITPLPITPPSLINVIISRVHIPGLHHGVLVPRMEQQPTDTHRPWDIVHVCVTLLLWKRHLLWTIANLEVQIELHGAHGFRISEILQFNFRHILGLTLHLFPTLLARWLLQSIKNGPYIFDSKGNLVYCGYGSASGLYAHDLKIAEYNGEPVLTFYAGNDEPTGDRGHGIILNSNYETLKTVTSGRGRAPTDVHEFTVLDGKTALTTIFQPTQFDLSSYGVKQPWGWVVEGIFQEIDIATGEVLFEWRSLDHEETLPSHTYNTYGSLGTNNGSVAALAWDYFHMNSVEKDANGNYLMSSRYLCAIFYIDGRDGSIIWQLNGKSNQFTFSGFPNNTFPFGFQHHARLQSQNETTTILSIFDNGSDGGISVSNASSGMIMALNLETMTCTLLHQYQASSNGTLLQTTSQGNTQVLNNSNVFIGWGDLPYISEYATDGTLLMQAQWGAVGWASSYRTFKAPWVGTPDSTPALFSESSSTSSPTTFYTSWNGATEIATWSFFGGPHQSSVLTLLGNATKGGFETNFTASGFVAWGYSQALDKNGKVLGTSQILRTYYPGMNTTVSVPKGSEVNIQYPQGY